MNPPEPSHDAISTRAYHKWEDEGRPEGRAEEFWLNAERELKSEGGAKPPSDADPLNLQQGPEISNMDRALPPRARREVRSKRRPATVGSTPQAQAQENPPHFVVLVDRAHLRIYRMDEPDGTGTHVPTLAAAVDEPMGKESYVASDSDQAGQFPGSRKPRARGATSAGGANDERLPMKEERDRRLSQDWCGHIARFLNSQPGATWDYAAGPAMHRAVLDQLAPELRDRLQRAMIKDLVNVPPADLRQHFGENAAAAR